MQVARSIVCYNLRHPQCLGVAETPMRIGLPEYVERKENRTLLLPVLFDLKQKSPRRF